MKRIVAITNSSLMAALFVLCSGIAVAQNAAPPSAQPAEQGTFQCEEKEADRGDVRVGHPLEHTFHLVNTSNEMRHILKVLPGCGCTKVIDFTKDVAPHSHGYITASFGITGIPGLRKSYVLVQTDDPTQPQQVLLVSCRVLPAIEIKPAGLQFTPAQSSSGFGTQTIELTGLYPDERISVGNVQPSDPLISITKEVVEEHKRFRLRVAVSKDAPAGITNAQVAVAIEGSAQKAVWFPITITNETKLKAEPSVVELAVDPNALQSPEFVVKALDDKPLEVSKVELSNKELQIVSRRVANNAVSVRLENLKLTCNMNRNHLVVSTNHGQLRVPTVVRSCAIRKTQGANGGPAGTPKT